MSAPAKQPPFAMGRLHSIFKFIRPRTSLSIYVVLLISTLGIVSVAASWFSLQRTDKINDINAVLLRDIAAARLCLAQAKTSTESMGLATYKAYSSTDPDQVSEARTAINDEFNSAKNMLNNVQTYYPAAANDIGLTLEKLKLAHALSVNLINALKIGNRSEAQRIVDLTFDAARDDVVGQFNRLINVLGGKASDADTESATQRYYFYRATLVSSIVGVAGALIIVYLISVFVITRPLRRMTGGMQELAAGNLDVTVFGLGRKDEIGDIAKTALIFKENGLAKIRMEQEQKEAEKRSAAEREAAIQKMAAEFEAAVGGIVQAAVAGDFSQRVDLQGKTGMVLNIGTAINSLCENVAKALDDLINMLNSLAEGDLTQRITAEYQGNFAVLKDNANKTAERIGATIAEIKASAAEVTNASAEISTSTTDLSQRTEEQAASLEETSASMEEIAGTVKKNAEYAQAANQSASATRDVADRGGQVVAKAVEAMAKIEDSSRKISDIIGVIDEIARQTNLLALNAAVEAARAGEAGRGFAVVASEVRSLAQRSSQAAKDIKDLITNSNDQVKGGVELVNRAGSALTEIVDSIKKVAEIVADIANASNEQSTGIEQVNKALTQMDEVTQQNSALVEENAATAKTLEHQAKAMDERVSFFKLNAMADDRPMAKPAAACEQRPVVASPSRGPAAVRQPAASRQQPAASPKRAPASNAGGPVRRMQATLTTAVNADPDWKEF